VSVVNRRSSSGRLDGVAIGRLVRNSTAKQLGNWSSVAQEQELDALIEREGGSVVPYDEQGTSGRDLSKWAVALQMLADVEAGRLQGIAAYDIKRLTRDEWGVDGATIAKRLVAARAVLVTRSRVYELWNESDLTTFQIECLISGIDIRGIRRSLWRGVFARAANEVFFLTFPAVGYATRIVETNNNGRTKIKREPVKEPAHAAIMADLVRGFDECLSFGLIARRLNDKGLRPIGRRRPHVGQPVPWDAKQVRRILHNPLYTGWWDFGRTSDKRSLLWEDYRDQSFRHHVPDLAYWTVAQAQAWRQKFAARSTAPGVRARRYAHPLRGVLCCASCGTPMISSGVGRGAGYRPVNRYKCPIRHDRTRCPEPQSIYEHAALAALRAVMPRVLDDAKGLADEAKRQRRDRSEVEQRLHRELDEAVAQAEALEREWRSLAPPRPAALARELAEAEHRVEVLRQEAGGAENEERSFDELAAYCQAMAAQSLHLFDGLSPERQAMVYQALLRDVRVAGEGHVFTRRHEVVGYTCVLTGRPSTAPARPS
jgi:hypothetical protein